MQAAVRTLLVELGRLPAAGVAARHLLLRRHVLTEEELLLRHELEADRVLEVEEADLLILVKVQPVEDLHDHGLLGKEAPAPDDLVKLLERDVATVVTIQLVECLPQRFVLGLDLAEELCLERLTISSQDTPQPLLRLEYRIHRLLHVHVVLGISL